MTHCLLFDSDGTLVDSEAINTEALADELALYHIIEDSEVGVQAASAAAMKCVHYNAGGKDVAHITGSNVVSISSMLELPAAVALLESQA